MRLKSRNTSPGWRATLSNLWWGKPFRARVYHIFEGDGRVTSLCNSYLFANDGGEPEVSDDDEWRDGKDCKTCSRKAGLLETENN